jgi:hypothetical protein
VTKVAHGGGFRAAVVVGVALAVAAGCSDGASDAGDGDPAPQVVDLVVAPDSAVTALVAERAASATTLVGVGAMPSAGDLGEARAHTDEALAGLRDAVEAAGDDGTTYAPAMGTLEQLAQARAEVDARAGSIGVGDVEALRAAVAPYAEMTTAVLDAAEATARSIDDPGLRRGAELYAAGIDEFAREEELGQFLLLETMRGGLDDSGSVAEATRLTGGVATGRAEVMELASGGDYADLAERLRTDLAAADLTGVAEAALETGQVDVQALVDAATVAPGAGWPGFLTGVEDVLRRASG